MPMRIRVLFLIAVSALAIAPAASAHHGDAGYDVSKLITIKGTVTEFRFINPHIQMFLDVKKDDGSTENWLGELNSPNIVARMVGWTGKTFKPGDEIVLTGYRAKNGHPVLRVEKVLRPDGTELFPKGGNGVTKFR